MITQKRFPHPYDGMEVLNTRTKEPIMILWSEVRCNRTCCVVVHFYSPSSGLLNYVDFVLDIEVERIHPYMRPFNPIHVTKSYRHRR